MNTPGTTGPSVIRTSLSPERLDVFGDFVDRLVTIDIQTRSQHLGLYDAARKHTGGPLCLTAARTMLRALVPNRVNTAVFTTGFFSPAYWCGEQDGPVGVACLARALETGISMRSVILTDEELVPGVEAACVGAGYKTFDVERALTVPKGRGIAVVGISKDPDEAQRQVSSLYDRIRPAFVGAVERPSGNAKGEYHNLRGLNMTALTAKTDCVLIEAKRRGIPTVAVGDGGNELGYGAIEAAVEKVRPNNARCQCPCGGTVASTSRPTLSCMPQFRTGACTELSRVLLCCWTTRELHRWNAWRRARWNLRPISQATTDGSAGWTSARTAWTASLSLASSAFCERWHSK